jgi:hypothetical protein
MVLSERGAAAISPTEVMAAKEQAAGLATMLAALAAMTMTTVGVVPVEVGVRPPIMPDLPAAGAVVLMPPFQEAATPSSRSPIPGPTLIRFLLPIMQLQT